MSLIGVARHNEKINVILYTEPPPRPKSAMYISEKEKKLKEQKHKPTRITMGQAETTLRSPRCYLRKHCGTQVPRKEALPDSEDFIRNKNIKTRSKKTEKKCICRCSTLKLIDSPRGHRSEILTNKHIRRKNYGRVPEYILKQKREIKEAEDAYMEKLKNSEPLCRAISKEERQQLLDGLKHNLAEFKKSFLLLPILTDTIPKVMHKTHLEKSLLQIEKDVRLVESNPYIYVYE